MKEQESLTIRRPSLSFCKVQNTVLLKNYYNVPNSSVQHCYLFNHNRIRT